MDSESAFHENKTCKNCQLPVPGELKPYFDCLFIYFTHICEGDCHVELKFESKYPEGCYARWIDEARAMKKDSWVVPEYGKTYCGNCAQRLGIKHDPSVDAGEKNIWWLMGLPFISTQNQILSLAIVVAAVVYGLFFVRNISGH